jgi:uncharacterized membrane protein YfcA
MDLKVAAVGFVIGFMVGMTGMGGGALMTPALILLGWARPMVAVGTDLMWGTLTKSVGAFVHFRQGTVDSSIVKRLALGSVPGAVAGLVLLARLQVKHAQATDRIIVRILGAALICVAFSLLIRSLWGPALRTRMQSDLARRCPWLTSAIGAFVGFLVSLTSVGSGSVIVACLLLLYPTIPLRRVVGSDIVHALLLVGISAVGHIGLGSINVPLLVSLLVGSIPGVWLGSRLSLVFPEKALGPIMASTLFFLGYKLL